MATADNLERKLALQRAQAQAKAPAVVKAQAPVVVKPQPAPTVARAAIASIAAARPSAQTAQARSASTPAVVQRSSVSTAQPTRGQKYTDANGFVNTWNPRSGIYEVSGKVAVAAQPTRGQTYTDANGFVNTWNPRSGIYEVSSTVKPKPTFTDANGFVHTWNPRSGIYEVSSTVKPKPVVPVVPKVPKAPNVPNVPNVPKEQITPDLPEEDVQTSYQFDNAPGDANVAALTAMARPTQPTAQAVAPTALANRTVTQAVGRGSTITDMTPAGITNMTTSPFFQTYNKKYPRFNLGMGS